MKFIEPGPFADPDAAARKSFSSSQAPSSPCFLDTWSRRTLFAFGTGIVGVGFGRCRVLDHPSDLVIDPTKSSNVFVRDRRVGSFDHLVGEREQIHSGSPAFRRPSINSFAFVSVPRAVHADIVVKAGSTSRIRAAASRASASRPRWAKAAARQR
jgi:hypothetical protein